MIDFTRDEIIDFIYAEARMLDEGRYDEWLALWLDDGHYWMPLDYKQDDPHLTTSLLYEDMFMLKLRVRRLKGARTYSRNRKAVVAMSSSALLLIFLITRPAAIRPTPPCIMWRHGLMTKFCWH